MTAGTKSTVIQNVFLPFCTNINLYLFIFFTFNVLQRFNTVMDRVPVQCIPSPSHTDPRDPERKQQVNMMDGLTSTVFV